MPKVVDLWLQAQHHWDFGSHPGIHTSKRCKFLDQYLKLLDFTWQFILSAFLLLLPNMSGSQDIVTKRISPIKIQEPIFFLNLTISWFATQAPVLNFLCILSWIDVINCISNFWNCCYVTIMYSSVFNQVRRRKVLYFLSNTFLCIDTGCCCYCKYLCEESHDASFF